MFMKTAQNSNQLNTTGYLKQTRAKQALLCACVHVPQMDRFRYKESKQTS